MNRGAIEEPDDRLMTGDEVRAIRDQLGGTKAMAEKLEVTPRAVRHLMVRGVRRAKLEREIRGLVERVGRP